MMSLPPPSASSDEEQLPRRRGRLRRKGKKSGRGLSAGIEKEVKGFPEPGETQVNIEVIQNIPHSIKAMHLIADCICASLYEVCLTCLQ